MSPLQYLHKLTDYSDEPDRYLNFIESYYSETCGVNIITTVGFGPGSLKTHEMLPDPTGSEPYMFYFTDLPPALFPRRNPGATLTFGLFKRNIMCMDQPWICGSSRTSAI